MSSVFIVRYRYDAAERTLAALRPDRMRFFQELEATGALWASGQVIDGEVDGMLVLSAGSRAVAEEILDGDPFAVAGVISMRTVEAWVPTVGAHRGCVS